MNLIFESNLTALGMKVIIEQE